jgi:6-phosphogluconolactonase
MQSIESSKSRANAMDHPAIHEAATMTALAEILANRVSGEIADIIADKGHCVLALAGGKTPVPFFHALLSREIEWDDVTVTLTDERYVPLDHPDSNEAMIRRELLIGPAAKAKFIGLYAYAETAEASLVKLKPPAPLDIVVAGMGDDMHTLSWFPGADGLIPALSTAMGPRLAVVRPGILTPRITFTAKAVGEAKAIHLLIAGEKKKAALEAAFAAPSAEVAPVKRLLSYRTVKADVFWSAAA